MRIAFLGDSITEGVPKVSFFDMLSESFSNHELVNYGKGGDTVKSIFKRIQKLSDIDAFDIVFLFVGINDIYSKINRTHKILKRIRRQTWCKSIPEFEKRYLDLILYLKEKSKKLIVLPPLLFGEDLENEFNQDVADLETVIKSVISPYKEIEYLDARKAFIEELKNKEISDYIPYSLYQTILDVRLIDTNDHADLVSESRGLHVTLDGVHLNTKGARIIHDLIFDKINQLNDPK